MDRLTYESILESALPTREKLISQGSWSAIEPVVLERATSCSHLASECTRGLVDLFWDFRNQNVAVFGEARNNPE